MRAEGVVERLSPKHVTLCKDGILPRGSLFSSSSAPRKELLSQLTHRGHLPSHSFCCGESPRRRRVCHPVCVCHGKHLPLRRQLKQHVQGPLIPSSGMWLGLGLCGPKVWSYTR